MYMLITYFVKYFLLQECEDRDRSITEFNLREKQLKQEIQSLYDQIDDCQARERTYTNESFRSRLGENILITRIYHCDISMYFTEI